MLAIWKREVQNYLLTPIGYVFMGMFLLLGGVFFTLGNLMSGSSDISSVLSNLSFVLMLLVPILTMKLLSEEKRNKSDQLLITSPRSIWDIVLGKYLAAVTVLAVSMIVTLFYVVIVAVYSTPHWGVIFTNYLGFLLMGMCYIAIGVLMSSLTESQVSAAVLTLGINILLQFLEYYGPQINVPFLPFLPLLFKWLLLYSRGASLSGGMLSLADVVYYFSFCGVFLFLAVRVIDKRRWSEG